MAYGQSASLSETSAAVQELNASLRFEQDKLSAFNTQIAQIQHYAQEMDDGYQELTIVSRNTQTELQNSDKGLRKGYKYLHNTILELEELLEKNIFSDETEEKTKIWNAHNILTTLNKAKTLLHDGILNFIEAQKKTEEFNQILQSAVEKSKKQDTERTKIIDIYQSILKQLDTQTDASDGISTALNGLASKSSDYSDSAADLAQVANEASKLAVLLKDLLHEFKLP